MVSKFKVTGHWRCIYGNLKSAEGSHCLLVIRVVWGIPIESLTVWFLLFCLCGLRCGAFKLYLVHVRTYPKSTIVRILYSLLSIRTTCTISSTRMHTASSTFMPYKPAASNYPTQ